MSTSNPFGLGEDIKTEAVDFDGDDDSTVEDTLEEVDPTPGDGGDEFPADQYSIRVNGKIVWTSGSEAMLVNRVSVGNARGEVTAIGSSTGDKYLDITVNVRNAMGSDLDLVERRKELERTTILEEALSPEAFEKQEERNKTAVKTVEKSDSDDKKSEKAEAFTSFDETTQPMESASKVEF